MFARSDVEGPGTERRVGVVVHAMVFPSGDGEARVAGQVIVGIDASEPRAVEGLRSPGLIMNRAAATRPAMDAWVGLLSRAARTGGSQNHPPLRDVIKLLWPSHAVPSTRLARRRVRDVIDDCISIAAAHRAKHERVAIVAIDDASAQILADRFWSKRGMIARWRGAAPSTAFLPIIADAIDRVKEVLVHGEGLAKQYPGNVAAAILFYREALGMLERARSLDDAALRDAWLALAPDVEILTVADAVAIALASPPGDGVTIVPCEAGMTIIDVLAATRASFKTLVLTSKPVPAFPGKSIPEDAWVPVRERRRQQYPRPAGTARSGTASPSGTSTHQPALASALAPMSRPASTGAAHWPPGTFLWENVDCEWPVLERDVRIALRDPRKADLAKAITMAYLLHLGPASGAREIASASALCSPAWFEAALHDLAREKLAIRDGDSWKIPGGAGEMAKRWLREARATRDVDAVARTCLLTGSPLPGEVSLVMGGTLKGDAIVPPPVVPPADLRDPGIQGGLKRSRSVNVESQPELEDPSLDAPARVVVTRERHVLATASIQWRVSGKSLLPTVSWKGGGELGTAVDDGMYCLSQAGEMPPGLLPAAAPERHHPGVTLMSPASGAKGTEPAIVPPAALAARARVLVASAGRGVMIAFLPPVAGSLAAALDAAMAGAGAPTIGENEVPAPLLLRVAARGGEAGIDLPAGHVAITLPQGSLPPDIPSLVASKERVLSAVSVSGLLPGRVLQAHCEMEAGSSEGLKRVVQAVVAHVPAIVQKLLAPGRADMPLLARRVELARAIASAIASLSEAGARAPQLALDATRKFMAIKSVDALMGKPSTEPVRAALVSWVEAISVLLPPLTKKEIADFFRDHS